MKLRTIISVFALCLAAAIATSGQAPRTIRAATADELARVMKDAKPGDAVEMADGVWQDAHIDFSAAAGTETRPVTLRAQRPGRVTLTGTSYLTVNSPYVVVDGLYFVRTQPVETQTPVIDLRSDHGRLVDTVIENYNPPNFDTRYHWVRFSGSHNTVERCFFSGKNHQAPVIALNNGKYNTVRYSYFKDMPYASPNGREIIQAVGYGSSEELGEDGGFMTIEYNLFDHADGEGAEIISLKSNRNIVRFNTIIQTRGGIVGRSGNFNLIEGNIILGGHREGTAGIRLSGQGHRVIDNYIADVAGPGLNLYAGEYFVDEQGKLARLTPGFEPIMRENTQHGAVPAYGWVKDGVFERNTLVNTGGPAILVGGEYKAGWPARQRILMPEGNRIANNKVFSQRQASEEIKVHDREVAPPLDRFSFRPNIIQSNTVIKTTASVEPGSQGLTAADVGPEWLGESKK